MDKLNIPTETVTHSDYVCGIMLHFEDLKTSATVPYVFNELKGNFYGLEHLDLTPEDTVIDVGANVGMFSIYVKKKFGCKVISFEPVPENFERLKSNILLNGLSLDDFELHNVAITDEEGGVVRISTPLHCTGSSSQFLDYPHYSECPTETLDKYITEDCTYLKLDCEGGEYAIIPAILDKINQFKYIGIEFHRLHKTHDPEALYSLLQANFRGVIFG